MLADLGQARDRRRQAQWQALRERGIRAAEKYLTSARAAHADLMAYAGIIDEANAAQFAAEARASFPFAPVSLSPELLAAFDRALERTSTVTAPVPAKPAKAPPPKKREDKPRDAAPRQIVKPAPKAKIVTPPPPKLPTVDSDGLVSIMATRNGVPGVDGSMLRMGATARLPLDAAVALLRSGAATQVAQPAETAAPKASPPEQEDAA